MTDVSVKPKGWRRWFWFLLSRKVQVAIATLITSALAHWGFSVSGEMVLAIVGVGSTVILGIAHEDNGRNRAAGNMEPIESQALEIERSRSNNGNR